MPLEPLAGKVAIVTGAGRYRGIGRFIALALGRQGANVVVTGSGRPADTYPKDEQEMGWRDIDSVAEEIVDRLSTRLPPIVVGVLLRLSVFARLNRILYLTFGMSWPLSVNSARRNLKVSRKPLLPAA